MPTLLIRNATVLVTMDDQRREIKGGGLYARDGWIEQVAPSAELPESADTILDLSDHLLLPGLVNAHHHLYQTLTRALPAAQDVGLFRWLKTLYPLWANLTPDDVRVSTQLGLAELALSGCTTASDHLYLFPNGCRLDDEIEAALEVGLRFHASRGSMSLGESEGGLPPDRVVEPEEAILADSRRVIETYHDPGRGARLQIALAPCSPFSVTPDLMRESAGLARAYNVRLHTHLAETKDEEAFCVEQFGRRPVAYAEELGWMGGDVWFAHAVHVREDEIERMSAAGAGVAHCPTSNMRLGSGAAPVRAYLDAGVDVGVGVDGSASNDGSHLLMEARQAMLLSRLGGSASPGEGGIGWLTGRDTLELATRGGAAVLGREDIGSLAPGKCADFTAIDLRRVAYAGAGHDPVAAAVFCEPGSVDYTYVHGEPVVQEGRLVSLEVGPLIEAHNRASRRLVGDL